jgi:hypothetical protein
VGPLGVGGTNAIRGGDPDPLLPLPYNIHNMNNCCIFHEV